METSNVSRETQSIEVAGAIAFTGLVAQLRHAAEALDKATSRGDRIKAADRFELALAEVKRGAQGMRDARKFATRERATNFAQTYVAEIDAALESETPEFAREVAIALFSLIEKYNVPKSELKRAAAVRSGDRKPRKISTDNGKVNWNKYLTDNHPALAEIRGTASAHAIAHAYLTKVELATLCGSNCGTDPRFVKAEIAGYARQK